MQRGSSICGWLDEKWFLVGIGAYWQNMLGWGSMSHTIADSFKLTNDIGELAAFEAVIGKIWYHTEHKQLQNQQVMIDIHRQCSCFEDT